MCTHNIYFCGKIREILCGYIAITVIILPPALDQQSFKRMFREVVYYSMKDIQCNLSTTSILGNEYTLYPAIVREVAVVDVKYPVKMHLGKSEKGCYRKVAVVER